MQKGRWLVIFLCFLAVAINYIDRANQIGRASCRERV